MKIKTIKINRNNRIQKIVEYNNNVKVLKEITADLEFFTQEKIFSKDDDKVK